MVDIYLCMSKNIDRYKESHLETLSEDDLLDLEVENFEKFTPKKHKDKKQQSKQKKNGDDE